MRELAANGAIVLALIILVGYLTLRAKRLDFEKFRATHTRRKYRVPLAQARSETVDSRLSTVDCEAKPSASEAKPSTSTEADTPPPR